MALVGLTKDRNLVGFAASRDERMRSYFIAEVVRCAYSYGCYQMEVFLGMAFPLSSILLLLSFPSFRHDPAANPLSRWLADFMCV